jgi:hypothetical protein
LCRDSSTISNQYCLRANKKVPPEAGVIWIPFTVVDSTMQYIKWLPTHRDHT